MVRDLQHISVRYWAGAKAAAGTDSDTVYADEPLRLADLIAELTRIHGPALAPVLGVCSALVDGRRVSGSADVTVHPGETVEFLPPFAGG